MPSETHPLRCRRLLAFAALLCCLPLGGCAVPGCHGPAQDHSRFEGAALMWDRTVLFSFKHLVYRPAEGLAAFPDGGVPKYLADEDLLATYHIPSGTLRTRGRRLLFGRKDGAEWRYEPLPLEPDRLERP